MNQTADEVDPSASEDERPATAPGESEAPETRALEQLAELIGAGADQARDYLALLAVEGRLAGRSLVLMLALGIVLALLLVSAWLFLNLAAALWLMDQQAWAPWQAVLVAAVAHAALAGLAWLAIRRLSHNLGFAGLRASVEANPATERDDD